MQTLIRSLKALYNKSKVCIATMISNSSVKLPFFTLDYMPNMYLGLWWLRVLACVSLLPPILLCLTSVCELACALRACFLVSNFHLKNSITRLNTS